MSSDNPQDDATKKAAELSRQMLVIQEDFKASQLERVNLQSEDPRYLANPSHYEQVATLYCQRDKLTIQEGANLLASCDPERPYDLPGEKHGELNRLVYQNKVLIENCLGISLKQAGEKGWFKTDYFESTGIVEWALARNIDVPEGLIRASGKANRARKQWDYSTPQLEAIFWVIDNFWEGINPKDSATQAQVMAELAKQFPNLSPEERKRVDQVTRHPSVTRGRRKKSDH